MTRSQETRPSFRRGGIVCPAGADNSVRELNFKPAGSHFSGRRPLASSARRVIPSHAGHPFKDPGSQSVVSSRLDVCRQPSRAPTHGLFLTRGCVDRALNIFTSRGQLGGDAARDGSKSLHAHNMERTHGEVVAVEYAYQRRSA